MMVLVGVAAEDQKLSSAGVEVCISALRAKQPATELVFEGHLYAMLGITGDLYFYLSSRLKVYAVVSTPDKAVPDTELPVLIYGHGFHSEPKKYGVTSD